MALLKDGDRWVSVSYFWSENVFVQDCMINNEKEVLSNSCLNLFLSFEEIPICVFGYNC